MRLHTMVLIPTYDGLTAAAPGICQVCGWRGWDCWDLHVQVLADGRIEHDDPTDTLCTCPRCGLAEVRVHLEGDEGLDGFNPWPPRAEAA